MINDTKVAQNTPVGRLSLIRHDDTVSRVVLTTATGYAGQLEPGDYSLLLVPPFSVDEYAVFELKARQKVEEIRADDKGFFYRNVNVRTNGQGINKAHYPHNNMIVAWCVDPAVGRFNIYQMMLISQNGEFFLHFEPVVSTQFMNNGKGSLVCPELCGKWQHLKAALMNWMAINGHGKNAKSLYDPTADHNRFSVVTEWDSAAGNGRIKTHYGEVFVTWRACPKRWPNGPQYLVVGEKVVITKMKEIKNPTRTSLHAEEVVLY